jgi:hypothetical protein
MKLLLLSYYDLLWMTCSITKGDILYWYMESLINDMKCVEYITLYVYWSVEFHHFIRISKLIVESCSSPNIVRVIKSRRIRCGMWHIQGRGEVYAGFWWGNLRDTDHLEDPDTDGRIILRWIISKWDVGARTASIWLRLGTGGGHLLIQ